MRRSTGFSAFLSLFRAGSAGALVLATILSCSDTTGPDMRMPAGTSFVQVYVPDSLKGVWLEAGAETRLNAPVDISANVLAPSTAAKSSSAAAWKYVISDSRVGGLSFEPEAIPGIAIPKEQWLDAAHPAFDGDGHVDDIPLGFSFNFYGNEYDKVNIYANGFLQFGPPQTDPAKLGFFKGAGIPLSDLPNNIIAFAWTDWSPQLVDGGVRFETRGVAPHRRFLLQFNNVPEYSTCKCATGFLMMQLVLEEGTNVITIYTNTLKITNSSQRITQGIENADGTAAQLDSVTNAINGVTSARMKNFFSLTNDVVRFTPPRPPTVTAPANVSVNTAPAAPSITAGVGMCSAAVNVGSATATDDVGVVSIVGVRSDGAALDAPYPKGVTTITWTATDTDGMTDSQPQTVTVLDKENPFITVPAGLTADNDPHLPSAIVATGSASAQDNCQDVTISATRSDGADLSAPFMVGLTKVTWKATDASGNSATGDQSITVRDVEAPSISVPENFTVNAASMSGAIVNYHISAMDNVAVVDVSCSRPSGSNFPVGDDAVTCTASDAAGNSVSGKFVVSVLNAQMQMQNLLEYLRALGAPNGATDPLANQLLAALNGDNHVACVKMNDFVSLAQKKARDLPYGSVPFMTSEANRICDVLGCSASRGRPQAP
jgi:hypothetical protein